ncbi:9638_t:CDS:1, partial [Acaulospora morrowiae]
TNTTLQDKETKTTAKHKDRRKIHTNRYRKQVEPNGGRRTQRNISYCPNDDRRLIHNEEAQRRKINEPESRQKLAKSMTVMKK